MLQPKVSPKILHGLMEEKGLTCSELALQSGIATKTISRLLNPPEGRGKRPRLQTIQAIAVALETDADTLCGKLAKTAEPKRNLPHDGDEFAILQTQINVRADHSTRNAMSLICRRYGVKPHQVVMLAPLLFHCVAELSLKRRRIRLKEIETKQSELEAVRENFQHLHARLWANPTGDEIFSAEEDSINQGKIFADDILSIEGSAGPASDEFYADESATNPFSKFVSDFVTEADENVHFYGFGQDSYGACYTFGDSLAMDYVKGNQNIANAIVSGIVGIHEIPTDLRNSNDRMQWLENKISERNKEAAENFAAKLDLTLNAAEKFGAELDKILNEDNIVEI